MLPAAQQRSARALRDRALRRRWRTWARYWLDVGLSFHRSAPPDPLMGVSRERERERDQTGESAAGPAGLDHCLKLRTSASCASVATGLSAEVLPAGSAAPPKVLPLRTRRNSDARHRCSAANRTLTSLTDALGMRTDWHQQTNQRSQSEDQGACGERDAHAAGARGSWPVIAVASDAAISNDVAGSIERSTSQLLAPWDPVRSVSRPIRHAPDQTRLTIWATRRRRRSSGLRSSGRRRLQ